MAKNFEFNEVYEPVFTTKARYIDIWGGRARGGSHFGTDYFLFKLTSTDYFRGVFLREILGTIKDSLWKDFKDRLEVLIDRGEMLAKDFSLNETKMSAVYIPTGNSIISKGFKKSNSNQSAKLKSIAGATHVLIEECEEVEELDFSQLDDSLRTMKTEHIQVIRLFNPPSKNHWLMRRFYDLRDCGKDGWFKAFPKKIPELLSIHTTYLDNIMNVHPSTIKNYQAYGDPNSPSYNPDFYCRNVLGLVSEGRKGRIFHNWKPMSRSLYDSLPYIPFCGLDWGFNDPNAVVECKYHDGKLFLKQLLYQGGLENEQMMVKMRTAGVMPTTRVYYDCANPKDAKTFQKGIEHGPNRMKGFLMLPSIKGADSILYGIRELQNVEVYYTEESKDIERESQEYHWALDANKEPTDEPEDDNNHAIDAIRYAYTSHVKKKSGIKVGVPSSGATQSSNQWEKWMDESISAPDPREEMREQEEYFEDEE